MNNSATEAYKKHCSRCRKAIIKGELLEGIVRIKCECGHVNHLMVEKLKLPLQPALRVLA